MVKLNLTKALEKELNKLVELGEYSSVEDYIVEKLLLLVVDEITFSDIKATQTKIKILQDDLNSKRKEILTELREEGGNN